MTQAQAQVEMKPRLVTRIPAAPLEEPVQSLLVAALNAHVTLIVKLSGEFLILFHIVLFGITNIISMFSYEFFKNSFLYLLILLHFSQGKLKKIIQSTCFFNISVLNNFGR